MAPAERPPGSASGGPMVTVLKWDLGCVGASRGSGGTGSGSEGVRVSDDACEVAAKRDGLRWRTKRDGHDGGPRANDDSGNGIATTTPWHCAHRPRSMPVSRSRTARQSLLSLLATLRLSTWAADSAGSRSAFSPVASFAR